MVNVYRRADGRLMGATTGALLLGGLGAVVGTSYGIVTAGGGSPATYYFGTAGLAAGGGGGYIAGSATDKPQCPNCDEKVDLGI
jgi:hypothetical protein